MTWSIVYFAIFIRLYYAMYTVYVCAVRYGRITTNKFVNIKFAMPRNEETLQNRYGLIKLWTHFRARLYTRKTKKNKKINFKAVVTVVYT